MDFIWEDSYAPAASSSSSPSPVATESPSAPPSPSSYFLYSASFNGITATAVVTSSSGGDWRSRETGVRGGGGSRVSQLAGKLFSAILTFIFAVVGTFAGAITGALIGLATESGLFRGAGIGAISGAVYSIEAVESTLTIWRSSTSGIRSVLFVMDIILSLLSGRIVYEKVNPAVLSAVQSQMSAVDSPFREIPDIFETGSTKGMSRESVDQLPKIIITKGDNVDASGEKICCSVCLQDFQIGETVRSLPHCHHMFHMPCIDDWLIGHGSCPLCRRDF